MELTLEHICKKYKHKEVLRDVNLQLSHGVHGLLGANGSGKTTLMRIICGLLPKDCGIITCDQMDIYSQYDIYASHIGYLPQHFGYYPYYTVYEFLNYMGILKNLTDDYSKSRIELLLRKLNLIEQRNVRMKHLSGGMLQRVGIAQALLNEPEILILDEPTVGLDPKERIIFRNSIAALSQDCIVLLSTHIVSDIETIADTIIVLKEGSIILHDTPDGLLQTMEGNVWNVTVSKKEACHLMAHNIIIKNRNVNDMVELRILSDTMPNEHAVPAAPDLNDLYLYHFNEGETL